MGQYDLALQVNLGFPETEVFFPAPVMLVYFHFLDPAKFFPAPGLWHILFGWFRIPSIIPSVVSFVFPLTLDLSLNLLKRVFQATITEVKYTPHPRSIILHLSISFFVMGVTMMVL